MYFLLNGKIYKIRKSDTGDYYTQSKCKNTKIPIPDGVKLLDKYPRKTKQVRQTQDDLAQELNILRMENNSLNESLADLRQTCTSDVNQQRQLQDQDFTQLRQQQQRQQQRQRQQRQEHQQRERNLTDMNLALSTEVAYLREQNAVLQARQPPQRGQLAETKTALQELSLEYDKLLDDNEALRMKLKSASGTKVAMKQAPQSTQSTQYMEASLLDARTSNIKLAKENVKLKADLATLETDYNELNDAYQEVYQELLTLRRK